MYLATSVVAAGSDNVRMTINAFVMAAMCYPDIVRKARVEIDRICGSDAERLPELRDMQRLTYISAMIKEGLRWRPTVPLIPQHRLTQDLDFECYHFPAGTDFVINSLAVCQEFEDAAQFKPERWLDGKEDSVTQDSWQFGGGRRVCVGYKVAQQELFLTYSRLIYCFDFAAVRLVSRSPIRSG
jgi:cytochrome P450